MLMVYNIFLYIYVDYSPKHIERLPFHMILGQSECTCHQTTKSFVKMYFHVRERGCILIAHETSRIHFIFTHLINQLQKVCIARSYNLIWYIVIKFGDLLIKQIYNPFSFCRKGLLGLFSVFTPGLHQSHCLLHWSFWTVKISLNIS